MNRSEVQNKGQGRHKNSDGKSVGPGTSHRGISRTIRENKRAEAFQRDKHTHPEKRKAFWRERGFTSQSHAARVIGLTVLDANEISAKLRREVGLAPLPGELLNQAS